VPEKEEAVEKQYRGGRPIDAERERAENGTL